LTTPRRKGKEGSLIHLKGKKIGTIGEVGCPWQLGPKGHKYAREKGTSKERKAKKKKQCGIALKVTPTTPKLAEKKKKKKGKKARALKKNKQTGTGGR